MGFLKSIFAGLVSLALVACASLAPANLGPPPAAQTAVDNQAIKLSFETLRGFANAFKALVQGGNITAGSPKALAISDALEDTLNFLNRASRIQQGLEKGDYFGVMNEASKAFKIANDRLSEPG